MKEITNQEAVAEQQKITDKVVAETPKSHPEVSPNSMKETGNPLAQLVTCRQTTKEVLEKMPDKPSKESMLALYRTIAGEQDYCLKVIAKIEPSIKGSQASEQFATAVAATKDRLAYEQALANNIFNAQVDTKKEMDNLFSMRVGLNFVRQQEDISWVKYQKALENISQKNNSSMDPTWIYLGILFLGYFLYKNWGALSEKYKEGQNRRVEEMNEKD